MEFVEKTIFISYSHDNEAHKLWVKRFADDLRDKGGFRVLLDQYLPKGASWTRFMQKGIKDADRVLVIGTPYYKQRSLNTGGVAFEEAIISNDFLIDIDTTKYYPILRCGNYSESFPPVLAGRNGDDFRNDDSYNKMLEIVISEIKGENSPILNASDEVAVRPSVQVAQQIQFMFETYFGRPTGRCEGIGITIAITNLSKYPMFFKKPHFEFDQNILDGKNAFVPLTYLPNNTTYPIRLEFGEVSEITYIWRSHNLPFLEKLLSDNSNLHFSAVAANTLGNVYYSDSIPLIRLVDDLRRCY